MNSNRGVLGYNNNGSGSSRMNLNPGFSSNSFFNKSFESSRGGLTSLGTGDCRDTSTAIYGDRDSIATAATRGGLGTRSYSTINPPRDSIPWMGSGGDRAENCQPQRNGPASLRGYSSGVNGLNPSPGIHQPVISGRSGIEALQGTPGGGRIHILSGLCSDRYGMDRERMKDQLAYSNSLATYGNCGILPGFQTNSLPTSTRKESSSIPWNQSGRVVGAHSPQSIVNLMARGRGRNTNNDVKDSPRLDSKIQEVIDSARSEIAKAGDFANSVDTRKKVLGAWPTMGTPRDGFEELELNADKRQRQEVYRVELERQIEQKNRQKADDEKKRNTHPLGPKYEAPAPVPQKTILTENSSISKSRKNDSSVMKKHLLMEKPSVTNTQRIYPHPSPSQSRFTDSYKLKQEKALMNLKNSRSGPLRSPFTPPQYKQLQNNNYGNTEYNGGSTSGYINSNPSSKLDFQSNASLVTDQSQAGLLHPSSHRYNNLPPQQQDYNNNNMEIQAEHYNQDQSQYQFNCPKPRVPYRNLTLPKNHNQEEQIKQNYHQISPRENGQPNYPSNNVPMGPAGSHQPHPPPGGLMMQPGINQYPGYFPTYPPPQPGHPSYSQPRGHNTMDPDYQYQNQQSNYSNGSFQTQQSGHQQFPQGSGHQQHQQRSSPHHGGQEQHYPRQMGEDANLNNNGSNSYGHNRDRDEEEYEEQNYRYRNSNKKYHDNDEYEEDQKLTTKDLLGKQKIWQRSDELPDKSILEQLHKDELKQQIEENKKVRANRLAKEKAEEEKLERQIQNYYEEQRRRLNTEQIRMEMEPRKQQVRRNDLPPPKPQKQYQRQPQQREQNVKANWRLENPESALARKLGNRKSDSNQRNKKEVAQHKTEYNIPNPPVIPRSISPPIPTIQRRMVLAAENGTDEPNPTKIGFPLTLSNSKMEFFKGLQSKLSAERDTIEKGLKNKLEKSPRHGSG